MAKKRTTKPSASGTWQRPADLTPDMARRLLHGLAENHRNRLEVLVRGDGRASMVELLGVTDDEDVRVLSYFQGALSRKIRRIVGDRDKRLHLIGWDYATTKWNADRTMITDGDCYITAKTTAALAKVMGIQT